MKRANPDAHGKGKSNAANEPDVNPTSSQAPEQKPGEELAKAQQALALQNAPNVKPNVIGQSLEDFNAHYTVAMNELDGITSNPNVKKLLASQAMNRLLDQGLV